MPAPPSSGAGVSMVPETGSPVSLPLHAGITLINGSSWVIDGIWMSLRHTTHTHTHSASSYSLLLWEKVSWECSFFFVLSGCADVVSWTSISLDVLNCVKWCVKQSSVQCSGVCVYFKAVAFGLIQSCLCSAVYLKRITVQWSVVQLLHCVVWYWFVT